MQIHSFNFLLLAIASFFVYWTVCGKSYKIQNLFLLLLSYVFYATWDLTCVSLLLITSITAYLGALGIESSTGSAKLIFYRKKGWWISFICIALNLTILGYFKYYNFFVDSFSNLFGLSNTSTINIILPVGISFYTFSAISYIVDVYKKKITATHDIVACLLYISFFSALLSGPIHKATEQLPQYLKKRQFDYALIVSGLQNILWGSFVKLCVADRIGSYVDEIYTSYSIHNGTTLLLASLFYTMQIYADFSGYSLVAIGLGKLFGIRLQPNFDKPYLARTITEFWSKWHMSLTNWFKNYLYIPLGGNRVSKSRWMVNIMIVFLLSGLWHGAAYTFIIWGGIHGLAQIIEKLYYGKRLREVQNSTLWLNAVRIFITFNIVNLAWIFFRIPDTNVALSVIEKIVCEQDFSNLYIGTFNNSSIFFYNSLLLLVLICKDLLEKYSLYAINLWNKHIIVRWGIYYMLICLIIMYGMNSSENFIYYQF